jgi:hypothetical protein
MQVQDNSTKSLKNLCSHPGAGKIEPAKIIELIFISFAFFIDSFFLKDLVVLEIEREHIILKHNIIKILPGIFFFDQGIKYDQLIGEADLEWKFCLEFENSKKSQREYQPLKKWHDGPHDSSEEQCTIVANVLATAKTLKINIPANDKCNNKKTYKVFYRVLRSNELLTQKQQGRHATKQQTQPVDVFPVVVS